MRLPCALATRRGLATRHLQGAEPAAIVASVGGGGLLMGVLRGVDRNGWGESVRVVACETHGANCLAAALDAGELVTLPGITSIAKSLGADRASPTVFDECTKRAAKGALGCRAHAQGEHKGGSLPRDVRHGISKLTPRMPARA